jgi:gliding motility-associated lipoprotein GldD
MPKPKGYFNIDLPQKSYTRFDQPGFPYTFEIPSYSTAENDTLYFSERPENPFWININFPGLNAQVNITYKSFSGINELDKLIADSYKLTFKHTIRADFIDETPILKSGMGGIVYEVGGNAATPLQFYLTDSSSHFIRGALYFNAEPNVDSVAPVLEFLKEDVLRMIGTTTWR